MLSLVYGPMKPFQNCRILFSISVKSRSIALLGQKDITVFRSKPTLSRANGYHDPQSMNIRGSFPLQGYSYVSCHQGQSILTVVSDRLPVTVSCHAQKRSGERKQLGHIQLQRPVCLDMTIEERDLARKC